MGIVCRLGMGLLMALVISAESIADEDRGNGEEEPLELDAVEALGMPPSVTQEVALRAIYVALQTSRSNREEDRHRVVCRHQPVVGTRLPHLMCGTNAAWRASNPLGEGELDIAQANALATLEDGGIWVSERPVSLNQLERAFSQLRDLERSEALINRLFSPEEQLPEAMVDGSAARFARAQVALDVIRLDWLPKLDEAVDERARARQVERMDAELVEELERHGFGVDAFNALAEEIESDETLRAYVAERVHEMQD